jgi:RimJ/RimL family protein N-acetyltransferase
VAFVNRELPLGEALDWMPARPPQRAALDGARVLLRPIDADADAESLYTISHPPAGDPRIWTYLGDGPYDSADHLRQALRAIEVFDGAIFFSLFVGGNPRALGVAAYLRISPEHGVLEIGNIWFGGALQRTTAASEAIYLMLRHAFEDLGYRRVEWKCNALNAASRRAAGRFGFTFEGISRKHQVVKGRNRDTAWYAITDEQWPDIARAFDAWLAPGNFDGDGRQRISLREIVSRG